MSSWTPADKTPPDPCRQDPARPLQTRPCQTPADKTLPDPCRQDPARPLQTRLCQTPADKTLPDPCRQDAAARQALRCRPAPRHARHYRPLHCALRHRYHKFAEKFYNNYWSRDALHTTAWSLIKFFFKIFIPIVSAAFHSAYLWAVCSLGRRFRFSPEIYFYSCSIRGVDYCLACDIICLRWFLSLTRVLLFKIETVRF